MPAAVARWSSAVVDGFDSEALAGVVNGAHFEQRQLAPGRFRACLQRVVFSDCVLDSGTYSLPVLGRGSFGGGMLALALSISRDTPMWANGLQVDAQRLMAFAEGSELIVRPLAPDWCWATLLIPRENLQAFALELTGRELDLPARGWRLYEGNSGRLSRRIHAVLRTSARWGVEPPEWRVEVERRALLAAFVEVIARGANGKTAAWMAERRHMLARRAELQLELARLERPLDARALSAALGIGERQIERLFASAFGAGPHAWQQVARLNAVRADLLHAKRGGRVTDVAFKRGFTHLGRFAIAYQEMFGEMPSQTQWASQAARSESRSRRPSPETCALSYRPRAEGSTAVR